jgi:hypothetical protein
MDIKRFIVIDEFGDSIRKFYTRQEAKQFMATRDGTKLVVLKKPDLVSRLLDDLGQAPF